MLSMTTVTAMATQTLTEMPSQPGLSAMVPARRKPPPTQAPAQASALELAYKRKRRSPMRATPDRPAAMGFSSGRNRAVQTKPSWCARNTRVT